VLLGKVATLASVWPLADSRRIVSVAGDGHHFEAVIVSAAFRGKNKVQQHQMVYAALKGNMGGVLHALQLQTQAK